MFIVSSCLAGIECKYNGGHNYSEKVMDFLADKNYITVCPEVLGGLPTPRASAEIQGDRIVNRDGVDVTDEFRRGAMIALEEALSAEQSYGEKIEGAIFQPRSPSCGCGQVYDGSFSGSLVEGDGITVSLFKEKGIDVFSPDEL